MAPKRQRSTSSDATTSRSSKRRRIHRGELIDFDEEDQELMFLPVCLIDGKLLPSFLPSFAHENGQYRLLLSVTQQSPPRRVRIKANVTTGNHTTTTTTNKLDNNNNDDDGDSDSKAIVDDGNGTSMSEPPVGATTTTTATSEHDAAGSDTNVAVSDLQPNTFVRRSARILRSSARRYFGYNYYSDDDEHRDTLEHRHSSDSHSDAHGDDDQDHDTDDDDDGDDDDGEQVQDNSMDSDFDGDDDDEGLYSLRYHLRSRHSRFKQSNQSRDNRSRLVGSSEHLKSTQELHSNPTTQHDDTPTRSKQSPSTPNDIYRTPNDDTPYNLRRSARIRREEVHDKSHESCMATESVSSVDYISAHISSPFFSLCLCVCALMHLK
jgi:hypothetical protein